MSAEHGTTPESVKREIKDILDSPYGSRALEGLMREAASNLEFEEAARLRDEIKRMKLMDLEFANEVLTAEGEAVDTAAPKRWRAEANAEKAERFRKGR